MKKYLKLGVGLVGTSAVMGSIPNLSGTETEAGIKGNFATGLSHVGSALPVMGKVIGTKMTLKSVGRLQKSLKSVKLKGVRKL